jgi:predicted DNA-binding antitoxin AbrB/MazE fold protein
MAIMEGMNAIHAVYEKGVFRPTEPVNLPDNTHVVFEPRVVNTAAAPSPAMARVYESLSHSYDTGIADLAARHDEHQP